MKGKEANVIACFDENKPAKSHTELLLVWCAR